MAINIGAVVAGAASRLREKEDERKKRVDLLTDKALDIHTQDYLRSKEKEATSIENTEKLIEALQVTGLDLPTRAAIAGGGEFAVSHALKQSSLAQKQGVDFSTIYKLKAPAPEDTADFTARDWAILKTPKPKLADPVLGVVGQTRSLFSASPEKVLQRKIESIKLPDFAERPDVDFAPQLDVKYGELKEEGKIKYIRNGDNMQAFNETTGERLPEYDYPYEMSIAEQTEHKMKAIQLANLESEESKRKQLTKDVDVYEKEFSKLFQNKNSENFPVLVSQFVTDNYASLDNIVNSEKKINPIVKSYYDQQNELYSAADPEKLAKENIAKELNKLKSEEEKQEWMLDNFAQVQLAYPDVAEKIIEQASLKPEEKVSGLPQMGDIREIQRGNIITQEEWDGSKYVPIEGATREEDKKPKSFEALAVDALQIINDPTSSSEEVQKANKQLELAHKSKKKFNEDNPDEAEPIFTASTANTFANTIRSNAFKGLSFVEKDDTDPFGYSLNLGDDPSNYIKYTKAQINIISQLLKQANDNTVVIDGVKTPDKFLQQQSNIDLANLRARMDEYKNKFKNVSPNNKVYEQDELETLVYSDKNSFKVGDIIKANIGNRETLIVYTGPIKNFETGKINYWM